MKLFQDTLAAMLVANPKLPGQACRVLNYVMAASAWGNGLPTAAETAEALGVQRTAVVRSYRQLKEAKFIIKRGTHWFLNPLVGWKGTEKGLEKAYREMYDLDGPEPFRVVTNAS